jgi:hypothetical protein
MSGTMRLMTHGGYLQDQISLLPKLKRASPPRSGRAWVISDCSTFRRAAAVGAGCPPIGRSILSPIAEWRRPSVDLTITLYAV